MKQSVHLSRDKSFTNFTWSQVVNVRDMFDDHLLLILQALKPGKPFHTKALLVAQETLEKVGVAFRPQKTAKAVLISPELWASTLAANPGAELTLTESVIVDDFLMVQNRIGQILPSLAPMQERKTLTKIVSPSGDVMLGFQYVDATLTVTGATPISQDGSLGEIIFDVADAGKQVTIVAVTQPHYRVIKVTRVSKQPDSAHSHLDHTATHEDPWGLILHPSLATTLGIALPTL